MNFFKQKTTWTNFELVPLRLCIASAYLLVGAYFNNFIRTRYGAFLVVFVITVVYSVYGWIKKLKAEN